VSPPTGLTVSGLHQVAPHYKWQHFLMTISTPSPSARLDLDLTIMKLYIVKIWELISHKFRLSIEKVIHYSLATATVTRIDFSLFVALDNNAFSLFVGELFIYLFKQTKGLWPLTSSLHKCNITIVALKTKVKVLK
jgi:hypothetical protein